MNRLNKFAFSKKLNKIIQTEADRERIRKNVGESGTYEENGKAYYYRDGKINKLDYVKNEELKLQAKLDPYIQDKETKQQLPYFVISGLLAVFLGSVFLRSLKKPKKQTEEVDNSNYEANYQQAVKEQEEYDEMIKQEKLKKFREHEKEILSEYIILQMNGTNIIFSALNSQPENLQIELQAEHHNEYEKEYLEADLVTRIKTRNPSTNNFTIKSTTNIDTRRNCEPLINQDEDKKTNTSKKTGTNFMKYFYLKRFIQRIRNSRTKLSIVNENHIKLINDNSSDSDDVNSQAKQSSAFSNTKCDQIVS